MMKEQIDQYECFSVGEGDAVIMLSGLFAGGWIWKPALEYLPLHHFQFICTSHPLPDLGSSITSLRGYVSKFLDQLNIPSCTIVGNSLGSLVGLDFAHAYPDRVNGVVISGAPGLGAINLGIGVPKKVNKEWLLHLAEKLFFDSSGVTDRQVQLVESVFRNKHSLLNMIRLSRDADAYDASQILPEITCPVQLIWGRHDEITPLDPWKERLHLLGNANLHVIEACGHSPMVEQPKEFASTLSRFLIECKAPLLERNEIASTK